MSNEQRDRVSVITPDWSSAEYDLGDDHPVSPARRFLAADLLREYGLLDHECVSEVEARPASDEAIARVHAPAYMAAVRRFGADPALAVSWEAGQWGLAAGGDTPAFAGMHEAAAVICGASVQGVDELLSGRADHVFSPQGGLHHAFAQKAAGFCIYNDTAVAIQRALDEGVQRVAYVDVDVHHGDGTQAIFYDEPRVLTVSVHQDGQFLFPGTGWLDERGGPNAPQSAVNVPLPANSDDGPYVRAVREVAVPAVEAFEPELIVTQMGVDPHHQDPLAHLQVSLAAIRVVHGVLHELAHRAAGGRWLALGGGGYNYDLVPRAWVLLLAEMLGIEVPGPLPAEWVVRAERDLGIAITTELLGDPPPEVPAEARAAANARAEQTLGRAVASLPGRPPSAHPAPPTAKEHRS